MDLISFAPRKASDNSRAAAAARIKDWATNEFASAGFSVNNDSARLMVSEVECMMPGCVPVETVIVLLREGHPATKTKILYPMSQVQRSHVRGAAFSLAASERLRDALSRELKDLSSKLTTPAGRPPFGGANPVQGGLAEDPQHALQVLEQLGFALQKHDEVIRPKFLAQYGDLLRTGEEKGQASDGAATGPGCILQRCKHLRHRLLHLQPPHHLCRHHQHQRYKHPNQLYLKSCRQPRSSPRNQHHHNQQKCSQYQSHRHPLCQQL